MTLTLEACSFPERLDSGQSQAVDEPVSELRASSMVGELLLITVTLQADSYKMLTYGGYNTSRLSMSTTSASYPQLVERAYIYTYIRVLFLEQALYTNICRDVYGQS